MQTYTQEQAKKIYQGAVEKGLDGKKVMYLMAKQGATFDGADMNGILDYGQKTYEPKPTLGQNIKSAFGERKENVAEISALRDEGKSTIGEVVSMVSPKLGEKVDDFTTKHPTLAKLFRNAPTGGVDVPVLGQAAGAVQDVIGETISAVVPEKWKEWGAEKAQQVAETALAQSGIDTIEKYNAWAEKYPLAAKNIEGVANIALTAGDVVGAGEVVSATTQGLKKGGKAVASGVSDIASGIAEKAPDVSGVVQTVKDVASRVPRAVSRVKEANAEAVIRATKIKNATPAVKEAMKSNLDDALIDTVTTADNETKKAYKEVVDIASDVKRKKQPSIVGGERAVQQFDVIQKQKKAIGKKLGDVTKSLSKTEKVDMQDAFGKMDDLLSNQGIVPTYTKRGVKLDFTGSKYTPAQRTKIQELYNLATEGGSTLSPLKIREKDQLFSALKREANFEGVSDIIIDTPEGGKNLFSVFRDIYSNKLDSISPEIKDLNKKYRELSSITDDLEDTIFKTPNFNATKSVDPAEFAKVNLRRIFGEAQSSPAFEAIADLLDTTSRKLGYKGASPKVIANFAEEMRKLFPDTIPKTGFQGGIKMGVGDIIEAVSKVGATNLSDKQKAIIKLLQDL